MEMEMEMGMTRTGTGEWSMVVVLALSSWCRYKHYDGIYTLAAGPFAHIAQGLEAPRNLQVISFPQKAYEHDMGSWPASISYPDPNTYSHNSQLTDHQATHALNQLPRS